LLDPGRVPRSAELEAGVDVFDQYIDTTDRGLLTVGPQDFGDFEAKLYVDEGYPHPPPWIGFLRGGFDSLTDGLSISSVGAVAILRIKPEDQYFAFTFGTTGRHLLRYEGWMRGYGLKTALNLIYPRGGNEAAGSGRLVAVDARTLGSDTIRSRRQSSRATVFEAFDIDKLRDMVGGATGQPADSLWGRRVTGNDYLHFESDVEFSKLGRLCRSFSAAHDRTDYKDRFGWLDSIQPVSDPIEISKIEAHIAELVRAGDLEGFELAPPEIVDWPSITGFQYHYDFRRRISHPDLRLEDYMRGLRRCEDDITAVDCAYLKRRHIRAVDADDDQVHKWTVWRCLAGTFTIGDETYVLDEGDIFAVSASFLARLDSFIGDLHIAGEIDWPPATRSMHEGEFNIEAARRLNALLLDGKLITASSVTTPIEVCDILTSDRKLIHVKRHLHSSELSHLFSQGFVSARLLQEDRDFRTAAHQKIAELTSERAYWCFDVTSLPANRFVIVFAIVASWRGRTLAQGLPFFSKVNLERTVSALVNRGFDVRFSQIDTA